MNNACLFDKATYDKFVKEIPQSRLITPSSVSERMKIRVSLARAGLQELVKQGNFSFSIFNIKTRCFASDLQSPRSANLRPLFKNLNLYLCKCINKILEVPRFFLFFVSIGYNITDAACRFRKGTAWRRRI